MCMYCTHVCMCCLRFYSFSILHCLIWCGLHKNLSARGSKAGRLRCWVGFALYPMTFSPYECAFVFFIASPTWSEKKNKKKMKLKMKKGIEERILRCLNRCRSATDALLKTVSQCTRVSLFIRYFALSDFIPSIPYYFLFFYIFFPHQAVLVVLSLLCPRFQYACFLGAISWLLRIRGMYAWYRTLFLYLILNGKRILL